MSTLLEQIKRKACTPDIITGAWHLAVKSKDIDAMSEIAAADDLPEGVLAAVMKRNEIPVAVSYLTRTGLDIEERRARICAEDRAGVLAGVLESNSITDDDRAIIAAKLVAKPTRALAEATLADQKMPLDAVAVAISVIDSRLDSLTDQQRRDLRLQIKRISDDPAHATNVAVTAKSTMVAQQLLAHHPELTDEAFETMLSAGIEPFIVRMAEGRITPNTVYHVVRELRNIMGDNRDYHPDVIYAMLNRHFDEETVAKIWTDLVGAARAAAMQSGSDYSSRMITAAESSDPEEIQSIVDQVVSTRDTSLVDTLLNNRHLTVAQLKVMESYIDERQLVKRLPIVAGDEEQVLHIYVNALSLAQRTDEWKSFPDPQRGRKLAFDVFVKMWHDTTSRYYSSETRNLLSILESTEDPMVLGGALPWELVQDQIKYSGSAELWTILTTLQNRHLGDDMKKWETADTLANGFSGSVEELFFTAANL